MQFLKRALVCLSVYAFSISSIVDASRPNYGDVMLTKAAEEVVAAPIQHFWKDVWENIVHDKGSKGLRKLRYLISRGQEKKITKFMLEKMKETVFDGQVNGKMWGQLGLEFFDNLREWWRKTPEDPLNVLEVGVWRAFIQTQKNFLGDALKGSPRVSDMHKLLFDPELTEIKAWVNEYFESQKGGDVEESDEDVDDE